MTEKVSLTLDHELVAAARGLAGPRGLSRYITRALRNQLQHDRLAGLLAQLEAEGGPISDEIMASIRDEWPADGASKAQARRSA